MKLFPLLLLFLIGCSAAFANSHRSHTAIAEFKRIQPCPSTGKRSGKCPGYDIDHRIPLKCNGDDSPENMQWLTKDEHQAKTAREAKECRKQSQRLY